MKGLVLGRFQPLHNGHARMIKKASDKVDELIIGIGSSNKSRTYKNPFTFDEREFMIRASVEPDVHFDVIGIPDFGNNDKWIAWIDDNIEFDFLMSNSNPEIDIFKEYGFEVRHIGYDNKEIRGTRIREMMLNHEDISKYVPPVVAKYINELNLKLMWV